MTLTDKHVICTLFDHRYLPRGLCMIESARRHGFAGGIWVLCLSDECGQRLQLTALPGVRTVTLGQLEAHIPRLKEARANRSILEYYFTCMAALHTYLFETRPDVNGTMYVDSDIQFFENWRQRAEPSPYYSAVTRSGLVIYSLWIHLFFATTTLALWLLIIVKALNQFPNPPRPSPHSSFHARWGMIAAIDMALTAVTGWAFYFLAFVA